MAKSSRIRADNYSDIYSKGLGSKEIIDDLTEINQSGHFFDNMDIEPDIPENS
jgi:hypothetical protein